MQNRIKSVAARGVIKAPKTTWDLSEVSGEVEQITTITLVVVDLPRRDIERLARSASEKVKIGIELTPEVEQTSFLVHVEPEEEAAD